MGPSRQKRCQQRVEHLKQIGLTDSDAILAFEEVTQQVAEFLQVPICMVTVADSSTEYVKAAYGLTHLGLGNTLGQLRQLPLQDGLGTYVLDSEQPFFVEDTGENPALAASQLVYTYGIGAYGAVPLVTSSGQCIGTLAIMDLQPRAFNQQESGYLAMASRWGMSEYERRMGLATLPLELPTVPAIQGDLTSPNALQCLIDAVRLHLIGQLIQDLCSPLTAVLGMTSMLGQEIYGPLTAKQREYINIIHNSSKALMERVGDVVELGLFEQGRPALDWTQVDIEMLGQQVINTLKQRATQRLQTFSISIEPGERLWTLDKTIVKQIVYHLACSIMQMGGENSTIRLHASRKGNLLQLAVWLSNPWLGDGLPQSVVRLCHSLAVHPHLGPDIALRPTDHFMEAPAASVDQVLYSLQPEDISRELLGLLLSQQLAEYHGGQMNLQGSLDTGYRLVVMLPGGNTSRGSQNLVGFTQA
jgi:hypothetical protein